MLDKSFNFLKPYEVNDLIRLGRNEDGGYIVSESIIKSSNYLLAFGMGADWSFEEDFLKLNKNNKVEIYDHTVDFLFFFKRLYKSIKRLFYLKSSPKNILKKTQHILKYVQINKDSFIHIKKKVALKNNDNVIDIENIFSNLKSNNIILKIDIENYEYKVLENIMKYKDIIKMIIIEFHELDNRRNEFLSLMLNIQKYFYIIHLHGNNISGYCKDKLPKTLEITFANKNIKSLNLKESMSYPIKNLDFPNHPYMDDISISFTS